MEGLVTGEVVVEAVLDHRADGHLGSRKQFLHGLGEDVGAVVADQFECFRVGARDDSHLRVGLDRVGEVAQFAIDHQRDGLLGQ